MIYSIPPRHSKGKDTHAYYENFLNNDEINKILAYPEWLQHKPASIGGMSEGAPPEIRKSNVAWLGLNQETAWLWEKLANVIADVNREYFKFNLTGCYEPIQLGIYKEEDRGHYSWHTDSANTDNNTPRKLSMSLILSDPSEYEGGQLQLKTVNDNIITVECPKGRAWFFPSYTIHRVTPVTKGIRRSLVLWIGGPEFK